MLLGGFDEAVGGVDAVAVGAVDVGCVGATTGAGAPGAVVVVAVVVVVAAVIAGAVVCVGVDGVVDVGVGEDVGVGFEAGPVGEVGDGPGAVTSEDAHVSSCAINWPAEVITFCTAFNTSEGTAPAPTTVAKYPSSCVIAASAAETLAVVPQEPASVDGGTELPGAPDAKAAGDIPASNAVITTAAQMCFLECVSKITIALNNLRIPQ